MFIEKLCLYLHLTKPSSYVSVSYAASSAKGEQTGPAYLFGTLRRLFPTLRLDVVQPPERISQIETEVDAKALLLQLIKRPGGAALTAEEKELFGFLLQNPENQAKIDTLLEAAKNTPHTDQISQAVARVLYGDQLMNSVSRIERYAACAYAHFLQYGLQISEREEYSFRPVDLGILLHACMELFGRLAGTERYTLKKIPAERENELNSQFLSEVMEA